MKIEPHQLMIRDYDYSLPAHKIAASPLPERDASRLLVYKEGKIADDQFRNLHQYLPAETALVLNNSRVIEARIIFSKPTGGQIEIFCLEPVKLPMDEALNERESVDWLCLIGGASKWKKGTLLEKTLHRDKTDVVLKAAFFGKEGEAFLIRFSWNQPEFTFSELLHMAGAIPLPPYIKRAVTEEDKIRYQTVFSKEEGSVAAPTAGLHFSDAIFDKLKLNRILPVYITLHVGSGTFKPVKTVTVAEHQMHQEPFSITTVALDQLLSAGDIIAVGTTSIRTLESLYWMGVKLMHQHPEPIFSLEQWEAYDLASKYPAITMKESYMAIRHWLKKNNSKHLNCKTSLIIVPGYEFKTTSGLITNFHQPQSTLLLLVSAFIGTDWKRIYSHALENDYRFLSYGDSSLLWRSF
jgi:S-adenosylmethionine:tRNA ribosyltransferase-isomerase